MKHLKTIWLAFVLISLLALGALAWVSRLVVQLDREKRDAAILAATEEKIRLALWRLDAAAAPLVARENARPWYAYRREIPVAVLLRYNNFSLANDGNKAAFANPEQTVASPLAAEQPEFVKAYFEVNAQGQIVSPQAKGAVQAAVGKFDNISARQGHTSSDLQLEKLAAMLDEDSLDAIANKYAWTGPQTTTPDAIQNQTPNPPAPNSAPQQEALDPQNAKDQMAQNQFARNVQEMQNRSGQFNYFQQTILSGNELNNPLMTPSVRVSLMTPLRIEGELMLVRRVIAGGDTVFQGCWLDLPRLTERLLTEVVDLLPEARLEPVDTGSNPHDTRRLTALPLRLVPGRVPVELIEGPSPIRSALVAAWIGMGVALVATAGVLHVTMVLARRRSAFVSAVTHELRTPLTTFRMYSEMLSGGMVRDEATRQSYCETLRVEAGRLGRLVENVLSFSRLERTGRRDASLTEADIRDVLRSLTASLEARARQAGMTIETELPDEPVTVHADLVALEQVLFNLVDNASKYAATAEDRRIHLYVVRKGRRTIVGVRDHGPGVPRSDRRRIFAPFRRGSADPSHTAGGVGLGLALCRRMVRRMGGRLRVREAEGGGAAFEVVL